MKTTLFPDDSVDGQSGAKKEDASDKEKKDEEETPVPTCRAKAILESWVWGRQPGMDACACSSLFSQSQGLGKPKEAPPKSLASPIVVALEWPF